MEKKLENKVDNTFVTNAEELIDRYLAVRKLKQTRKVKRKTLDEFVEALNGLIMFMGEKDRKYISEILNNNELSNDILKSITRIKLKLTVNLIRERLAWN